MRFDQLDLLQPILNAITRQGYETATPIQAQAIPHGLQGRDVLGCAQTGTGKTAAFALPMLQALAPSQSKSPKSKAPRALVLCPTRELATQIAESFRTYGHKLGVRDAVIFGGVPQHNQVRKLRQGIDVIIATPGRLLDLMNQGHVDLSSIKTLVLDEADRMLDMGFIPDIRTIVSYTPEDRQTLLFSATMPRAIRSLADAMLRDPAVVKVESESPAVELVEQSVYFIERKGKSDLLAELVNDLPMDRTIVFTRTKHGADKLVKQLQRSGIASAAIHGNKSQNQRQRSLDNFRADKVSVLVATDIASRGIDVDGVTHVVNFDLTHEPETYVHRIGRTARAGAAGAAISFCDHDEMDHLRAIERLLRESIPVSDSHPARPGWAASAKPARPQRTRFKPRNAGGGPKPTGGRSNNRPFSRKAASGPKASGARRGRAR